MEWPVVVPALALLSGGLAALVMFVRSRFDGVFAKAETVQKLANEVQELRTGLEARLDGIDVKLGAVPNDDELRELARRVGTVESAVAVVSAEVRGVHEAVGRVEADAKLILTHLLREKKTA
nr:DUF2730 family protein [Plastoroseomonas hellenica]